MALVPFPSAMSCNTSRCRGVSVVTGHLRNDTSDGCNVAASTFFVMGESKGVGSLCLFLSSAPSLVLSTCFACRKEACRAWRIRVAVRRSLPVVDSGSLAQ
jgi:hypothetical protein